MDSKLRRLLDESNKKSTVKSYKVNMEMSFAYILSDPNLIKNLLQLFFDFPDVDLYVDGFNHLCISSNNKLSEQNTFDFNFVCNLRSVIYKNILKLDLISKKIEDTIEKPCEILEIAKLTNNTLSKKIEAYIDQDLIKEVTRALVILSFAQISFEKEDYMNMSLYKDMYSETITTMKLKRDAVPSSIISEAISLNNKQKSMTANEARWQGHVEQQRQKYLKIDQERQSVLGKKLSIKDAAMWIYNNRNDSDAEYETIRNHLSKARKGIFTND